MEIYTVEKYTRNLVKDGDIYSIQLSMTLIISMHIYFKHAKCVS